MKKLIGRIVVIVAVLAVFGLVGKMDYVDQQADAARTEEIRRLIILAADNTTFNEFPQGEQIASQQ